MRFLGQWNFDMRIIKSMQIGSFWIINLNQKIARFVSQVNIIITRNDCHWTPEKKL